MVDGRRSLMRIFEGKPHPLSAERAAPPVAMIDADDADDGLAEALETLLSELGLKSRAADF